MRTITQYCNLKSLDLPMRYYKNGSLYTGTVLHCTKYLLYQTKNRTKHLVLISQLFNVRQVHFVSGRKYLYIIFTFCIESASGFIKNQNSWISENSPGNSNPLLLSSTKKSVIDECAIAIGKSWYKFMSICLFSSPFHLFTTDFPWASIPYVWTNIHTEKSWFLPVPYKQKANIYTSRMPLYCDASKSVKFQNHITCPTYPIFCRSHLISRSLRGTPSTNICSEKHISPRYIVSKFAREAMMTLLTIWHNNIIYQAILVTIFKYLVDSGRFHHEILSSNIVGSHHVLDLEKRIMEMKRQERINSAHVSLWLNYYEFAILVTCYLVSVCMVQLALHEDWTSFCYLVMCFSF